GSLANQFTITSGGGSFSLGSGASKTIKLKFCPTSAGTKTATLFADGTNCADDSSTLSGGVEAVPAIELAPASYNFGTVETGQCSSEYSFTLTNIGGGTATGSVSLTGTQMDQFTITSGSGSFSLGSGASKTITVKFCPTTTGSKTATLFADGTNCTDDSSTLSGIGADTIAPAAITDLNASNPTLNSIDLSWTAPGDDGTTGTATAYDIRYSIGVPITAANFAAATQVLDEPGPKPAGSTESFTVSGLQPNTTYYFAIKTADEVPNISPISNSPGETTLTPTEEVIPLPGHDTPPTDPDGDGLYEDLNGNGKKDFDDIVQLFKSLDWIEANEPIACFDFNANGRMDFDDIIQLFGEL
ncbi:MAG: choice-of-anchor D domain-containing protein, partial [Candidatus Methanospirareceae archaeon]